MVQTFATDSTNDIFLGPDGNLVVLNGLPAVVAACKTACQTQLQECVLQQRQGLPNFQLIWVGVPDYGQWQSFLQATLLNVSGVSAVNTIKLSARDNILSYRAEIVTIYGPATIQGSITQ